MPGILYNFETQNIVTIEGNLTILRMGFFSAAHGWRRGEASPP